MTHAGPMRSVRQVLSSAGDLLLGAQCPGCLMPGLGVCDRCRISLAGREVVFTRPQPCPPGFPMTATSSPYDPVMRQLITAHKEHQALTLAGLLGERLALATALLLGGAGDPRSPVVLAPIPSTARAVRTRGYDATFTLARLAGRALTQARSDLGSARAEPVRPLRLLSPARALVDQAGLDAVGRRANLVGGLSATLPRIWDRRLSVIIVDDVVTTGNSLSEAHRALEAAGIRVLGAAVIAATVRRNVPVAG